MSGLILEDISADSECCQALGFGIFDGLKDLIVMPVQGARKEGAMGAGKGFCKGFANMLCNFGEGKHSLYGNSVFS